MSGKAVFRLSEHALCQALQLPRGTHIRGVRHEPFGGAVEILLEHPDFPAPVEGQTGPPTVAVRYETQDLQVSRFAGWSVPGATSNPDGTENEEQNHGNHEQQPLGDRIGHPGPQG